MNLRNTLAGILFYSATILTGCSSVPRQVVVIDLPRATEIARNSLQKESYKNIISDCNIKERRAYVKGNKMFERGSEKIRYDADIKIEDNFLPGIHEYTISVLRTNLFKPKEASMDLFEQIKIFTNIKFDSEMIMEDFKLKNMSCEELNRYYNERFGR